MGIPAKTPRHPGHAAQCPLQRSHFHHHRIAACRSRLRLQILRDLEAFADPVIGHQIRKLPVIVPSRRQHRLRAGLVRRAGFKHRIQRPQSLDKPPFRHQHHRLAVVRLSQPRVQGQRPVKLPQRRLRLLRFKVQRRQTVIDERIIRRQFRRTCQKPPCRHRIATPPGIVVPQNNQRLRITGIRPQHINQQIYRIPWLSHLDQHHRQLPPRLHRQRIQFQHPSINTLRLGKLPLPRPCRRFLLQPVRFHHRCGPHPPWGHCYHFAIQRHLRILRQSPQQPGDRGPQRVAAQLRQRLRSGHGFAQLIKGEGKTHWRGKSRGGIGQGKAT